MPTATSMTATWVKDRRQGQGIFTTPDGYIYEGDWVAGRMEGTGSMTYPDGSVYDRRVQGRPAARPGGKITYPDGSTYEGDWEAGVIAGQGRATYATGWSMRAGSRTQAAWDGRDDLPGRLPL